MDLTVSKVNVGNYSQYAFKQKTKSTSFAQPIRDKEINLNNNPKNISFQGLFSTIFGTKNTKKQEPEQPKEPGIYGPYKLTKSQTKTNDYFALELVENTVACMTNRACEKESVVAPQKAKRAKNKAVDKMVPVCISGFAYYQRSRTSFPEFYDSIIRAFPSACAAVDTEYCSDNASRLYEKVMDKVVEYGKMSDPESEDPVKSGIAYLYFTDELPVFAMKDDEYSTEETLANIRLKARSPMMREGDGFPRCHMSTVPNEIEKYGSDFVKNKFGSQETDQKTGERRITNMWGHGKNLNYSTRTKPAPPPETEYVEGWTLDEFIDEVMRGI